MNFLGIISVPLSVTLPFTQKTSAYGKALQAKVSTFTLKLVFCVLTRPQKKVSTSNVHTHVNWVLSFVVRFMYIGYRFTTFPVLLHVVCL